MNTHNQIAQYLDNKSYLALNHNMQNMINYITGNATINLKSNPIIYCRVISETMVKPNIVIIVNNQNYYISVLSGHGNSVHEEQPNDFINFIRANGATKNIINFINDLCYSNKHTTDCIATTNPNVVYEVRQFFHTIRFALIKRAMQTGIYGGQASEFIYWGDVNHGYIQNINYVLTKLNNEVANTNIIAVGGLTLQRKNRFKNNSIQLKWHDPASDLL